MEERELLNKLAKADRTAFNELITRYGSMVLNICYRFLLNKQDAEDLFQEVFLEVFQSISSFRGDAKLSTWIHRITITKCLDELKKRNRKKRISSIGQLLNIGLFENKLVDTADSSDRLVAKDRLREISRALDKLPDNQRIAFTLSKFDGYSNPEIAEIMNTTTVAVDSLIYRARKKVLSQLTVFLKNN